MRKTWTALLLTLCLLTSAVGATAETVKHERIYVVAGADGTLQLLTANIRLENKDQLDTLVDVTELNNIINVGGHETFTQDGQNVTWQAAGADIVWQGTSSKLPPIVPVVRVTVDGQEVDAGQLAEQTGRVTLDVSYLCNRQIPALAVSVMMLPEEGISGLDTENALVLSESGRQVLLGWAIPGADAELELPDHFTATFDADHADISWMMTLITSDPVRAVTDLVDEKVDVDVHLELDEVEALLNAMVAGETLPEATGELKNIASKLNELLDGVTQLNDGAVQLKDGTVELFDGVTTLEEGTSALLDGAAQLVDGLNQASDGVLTLLDGLNQLTENNEALNEGAVAVFEAVLSTANSTIAASSLAENGIKVQELTADNFDEALTQVLNQLEVLSAAGALKALTGDEAVKAQLEQVKAGYAQLSGLKEQLNQLKTFVDGVQAYTDGVRQAADGAGLLRDGMNQLTTAVGTTATDLDAEETTLYSGIAALADGAVQLKDGAEQLKNGAATLQEEGTQTLLDTLTDAEKEAAEKLLPYVQNDARKALRLFETTRDQASDSGFDLCPEDMSAVTVYVIRTDLK